MFDDEPRCWECPPWHSAVKRVERSEPHQAKLVELGGSVIGIAVFGVPLAACQPVQNLGRSVSAAV